MSPRWPGGVVSWLSYNDSAFLLEGLLKTTLHSVDYTGFSLKQCTINMPFYVNGTSLLKERKWPEVIVGTVLLVNHQQPTSESTGKTVLVTYSWQDVRLGASNATPHCSNYVCSYKIKLFILKCFPELAQKESRKPQPLPEGSRSSWSQPALVCFWKIDPFSKHEELYQLRTEKRTCQEQLLFSKVSRPLKVA